MNRQIRKDLFQSIYEADGILYDDLTHIRFKPDQEPLENTDYYYNKKFGTYFSYYWGGGEPGQWKDGVEVDREDIEEAVVLVSLLVIC